LSPDELIKVIVQIVVLLFAVSVHESAHGWMALRCGDTTARDLGRITLNPIRHLDPLGSILLPAILAFTGAPVFGWAKPVPISLRGIPNPRRANLLISAAGPVSNLIVAVLFAVVLFLSRPLIAGASREDVIYPLLLVAVYSVVVNVALALFNLVPIPPLDGFGVAESLAPASWIPALIWMRRYGFVLLMIIIFTGGLRFLLGPQRVLIQWLLGGIQ
jgi:Zn-dependent protease